MKQRQILLVALCALFCWACAEPQKRDEIDIESLTEVYTPRYAKGFSIGTNGEDTVVVIRSPFQGDDATVQAVKVGSLNRIICLSSTHVAYLTKLNEGARVVGVSGRRHYTVFGVDHTRVRDVGYDGNLNYEVIASLKPDIVLLYGITGENYAVSDKLDELGINYAYIGEHAEISPLAKSEWLVAFGYMCGKSEQAIAEFDSIAMRYEALKQTTQEVVLRPKVMLNAPYQDKWYVPSDDSYMVTLLADAGGEYMCKGDSSHMTRIIDFEKAYHNVRESDLWLNVNQAGSLDELIAMFPLFSELEVVQQQRVYNNVRRTTASGGSDFWESGAVDADVVLKDLIEILHPELLDHQLYYYIKLR